MGIIIQNIYNEYCVASPSPHYTRIHIHRGGWISPISQSILNQFPWNCTHTIFHSCRDYPESFAKFW